MKYRHFIDRLFGEKLSATPGDQFRMEHWEAMEALLDKKPRRVAAAWRFRKELGLALLGISLGFVWGQVGEQTTLAEGTQYQPIAENYANQQEIQEENCPESLVPIKPETKNSRPSTLVDPVAAAQVSQTVLGISQVSWRSFEGTLHVPMTNPSPLASALFPLPESNDRLPELAAAPLELLAWQQDFEIEPHWTKKKMKIGVYGAIGQQWSEQALSTAGLGIVLAKPFGFWPRLGWQTQLGYRWSSLGAREVATVEQTTQGFYADLDQRRLVATASHGMDLGAQLSVQMSRYHQVLFGLGTQASLAWRGRQELMDYLPETDRTAAEQAAFTEVLEDYYRQIEPTEEAPIFRRTLVEDRGWLAIPAEERFNLNWNAGYQYQHPAGWSLGLWYHRTFWQADQLGKDQLEAQFIYWIR